MKYRWATQVMTRYSGMMTVYCRGKEQAEDNVERYTQKVKDGDGPVVGFSSIANNLCAILLSDIVAVHVSDMELLHEIHREDLLKHRRMERGIDFSLNKEE